MKIRILHQVHSSQHPDQFDLLAHAKSREIQALAPWIQLYGNALRETEVDDTPLPQMSDPCNSTPETQPTAQPSPVLQHDDFQDFFTLGEPEPWVDFNQYFPMLSNVGQTPGLGQGPTDYIEEIMWKAHVASREIAR
jgi:hypothetical protein